MSTSLRIALVGDHDERIVAHRAIPDALRLAGQAAGRDIRFEWIASDSVTNELCLAGFDGIWCVPGSPYRSMEGVLLAVHFARERSRPFLGTCGGFQHAVIEYARNVLHWPDAEHAEISPDAYRAVIAPLVAAFAKACVE